MMKITQKKVESPLGGRVLTLPDWSSFRTDTVIPELTSLLAEGRKLFDDIAKIQEPTFHDLVIIPEEFFERLSLVAGPVGHLNAVMQKTYPDLKEVNQKMQEMLTQFSSDISLNEELYRAYVRFRNSPRYEALSITEKYLIDRSIKDFELAGVALPPEKKDELKKLHEEGTRLGTAFSDNELASTDAWQKEIDSETVLAGIPADDKERMKKNAEEKGLSGWLITLQAPDYSAVLTYADDRTLREEVMRANVTKASELRDDGKWNNSPVILEILRNADASAKLLGYPTYADMSLEKKMARSAGVAGVRNFIDELVARARPKASDEFEAMKRFAKEKLGLETLEAWDFGYVSEKMMQELHSVDKDVVRQYFPFSKAMEGFALLLHRIFGVTLVERTDVSLWKDSVRFYEVHDEQGVLRGAFYADMEAREGKRSGAWMDVLLASRKLPDGSTQVPVAYLNCNVSRPVDGGEPYLAHEEVEVLFHEGGHVFHHLLGLTEYSDLSMEHVEWDTVELPSQLLENWCWEPQMLREMTKHRTTGEAIPEDLITRMIGAKFFNTGIHTLRQMTFGLFDWKLYSEYDPTSPPDANEMWQMILRTIDVRPSHPLSRFPNQFGHIFAGGYSAGYFSYMWALGLAADAFEAWKESGDVFSRTVGERYGDNVLAVGSSRPMADSFRAFRGRDLDPKALAKHLGLL